MKELMTYALESSICLLLFWLFYAAFLSGDTQHGVTEHTSCYL